MTTASPTSTPIAYACPCKTTEFLVNEQPLLRFICHCTICQSVYGKPFADILAFRMGAVTVSGPHPIHFKRLRPPPAVNRGLCSSCHAPAFGHLALLPRFGFTFVPVANAPQGTPLPAPSLHSFYDRRRGDVSDQLPKFSGYWPSQWAVSRRLMTARYHQA